MQHHYKYYQGLRRKTKARPLYLGSSIHSLLEGYIERGNWLAELSQIKVEYRKLMPEEKAEFGDIPQLAEDTVKGYLSYYREDGAVYPVRKRGRRTELEVRFYLTNQIQFLGYIDAYPQIGGLNWIEDHKTCKRVPDEDTRYADLQLLLYVWAAPKANLPKPDGVLWDYLRTKPPTIPERLKSGAFSRNSKIDTTYDVYMNTVESVLGPKEAAEYEEFAETLKGREERFYRRIFLPNPRKEMVEMVVEDMIKSANEILDHGRESKVRNMTRDCKQCPYYLLCQAEVRGLDSEFIRKSEYTVKEGYEEDHEEDPGEGDDVES